MPARSKPSIMRILSGNNRVLLSCGLRRFSRTVLCYTAVVIAGSFSGCTGPNRNIQPAEEKSGPVLENTTQSSTAGDSSDILQPTVDLPDTPPDITYDKTFIDDRSRDELNLDPNSPGFIGPDGSYGIYPR